MSTMFKCPHCEKTGSYHRMIETTTKENFSPSHEPTFTTSVRVHHGSIYTCNNCEENVTNSVEQSRKESST